MQDKVDLSNTKHDFRKENAVTLEGGYDILKCTKCGAKGKRHGVSEYITVNGVKRLMKEAGCIKLLKRTKFPAYKNTDEDLGQIQVTFCNAVGPKFANLIPGSKHNIITPPGGQTNWDRGVWVQGVGEPAMLLFSEFIKI